MGRLPWDKNLDLNVSYKPEFFKGFKVQVDVLNVFDQQATQKVYERYNTNNSRYNLYESVISYTNPRSVKFTAEYNTKF